MTEHRMDVGEMMTKSKKRDWRRVFAGVLVGLVVFALVTTTVILLTSRPDTKKPEPPAAARISLEDWLGGSLSSRSFNGTWISDDEILYRDESGNIRVFNVLANSSRSLLDTSVPGLLTSFDHQLSADRKYVLLASNYQKLYRHTYLAQYKIVNLETLREISLEVNNSTNLQLAKWSPRGNALVYIYQNNIYYRPEVEMSFDYQITANGVFGTVYNGVPDWVYEEEVFSSNEALWFSPNGSKLAFGYFDDTHTPVMNIPFYGYPGSLTFQYTSSIPIHYPKSGTTNPTVKLYCVDLEKLASGNYNAPITELKHPPELNGEQRILSAVAFPTENLVYTTWMNRVQNKAYFHFCDVETQNCTTAFSYSEAKGWVEQFNPPLFSADGDAFLLILPQRQKDNGDWRHLVLVTNASEGTSTTTTALTSGSFVVTQILSWDQEESYVYYLATTEGDPGQQHLYRVSLTDKSYKSECLSCGMKNRMDGTRCSYNTANFSPDNSKYVLTCAGPGIPDVSIYTTNNTKLFTWEDNIGIAHILKKTAQPEVKRFTVPVQGGFQAQARLLLPPNADLSGKTKYPMLVYVYGGPDSCQIQEKFSVHWGTYLATNKKIIYAAIDARGSGLKGNDMLFAIYRKLGSAEIYDQLNVTRYIQEKFPYVDSSRTAIWGWSYGGYAAGMTLAIDYNNTFKCGISVAPVTDWALYDSVYTERFMGLPTVTDNLMGYEQSQLLNKVDNIKKKMYYLIHGTLDDNVHYQQSLLLAKVLEQKDILFRQQTYTDEDHAIGQFRTHLYHSMENFLDECFERRT